MPLDFCDVLTRRHLAEARLQHWRQVSRASRSLLARRYRGLAAYGPRSPPAAPGVNRGLATGAYEDSALAAKCALRGMDPATHEGVTGGVRGCSPYSAEKSDEHDH